jgi:hypothetical protein
MCIDKDASAEMQAARDRFYAERAGYEGHHTQYLRWGDQLKFDIRVKLPDNAIAELPNGLIFEGSVELNALRLRVHAESSVSVSETALASVGAPKDI